jgi:hypothetical protein
MDGLWVEGLESLDSDDVASQHQWVILSTHGGLNQAIYNNDADELRKLLKAYCVSVPKQWGLWAMQSAAIYGQVDIIKVLLEMKVRVEVESSESHASINSVTPLALACCGSDFFGFYNFPETVELLIKGGANVNYRSNHGCSLLHYVGMYAHPTSVEVAIILIENGLDVNNLDNFNRTPLFTATDPVLTLDLCRYIGNLQTKLGHQTQVCKELLLNGADVSIKSASGLTPLGNARNQNVLTRNTDVIYLLEEVNKIHCVVDDFAKHSTLCRIESGNFDDILMHSWKPEMRSFLKDYLQLYKQQKQ